MDAAVHNSAGERLRVMYVCIDPPVPARTGYQVRVQTVVEALSRLADVRLLVLQQGDHADAVRATRKRFAADVVVSPPKPKAVKALVHLRAALANRNRWMEKFRHGPPRRQALEAIAAFAPDFVVLGHTAIACLRTPYRLDPSQTIIDHHNVESINYARMRKLRRGLGKLVAAVDERALRRHERDAGDVREHWAVSQVDRTALKAILRVEVHTVPNVAPDSAFAIDARGTRAGAPGGIGFMASYGYYPNVEAALELCAIVEALRADGIEVSATALGKDAPPHLERAARRAGVSLPGFVDDPAPILETFTLLLAPIRSGSGTKLKIIESLAMGIPVVTTELGSEGIPIALEGMGIVRETNADLAVACRTLLADRTQATRLGAAARRWAEANASMPALTRILSDRLSALSGTRAPP